MSLSNYLESTLLKMLFYNQSYTPPSSYYLSLSTKNIGEAAIDNKEPVAGRNYERVEIVNDISSDGFIQINDYFYNSGTLEFNEATGTAWGTLIAFGLWDAETGGNLIAYGSLANNKNVQVGDIARVNPTGIRIGID